MTGLSAVRVVLCDADGNLFPSEEPAFVASAAVTNDFLAHYGVSATYTPEELRIASTGLNFRSTALRLAMDNGVPVDPALAGGGASASGADRRVLTGADLQSWIEREQQVVTAHLQQTLQPDPEVLGPLTEIAQSFEVAAVSSSAEARIVACFEVTGLAGFFPPGRRFSAETSLPRPISKPDPAIYLFAAEQLGLAAEEAVAVEDSVPGVTSAVAAGFPAIGNLQFVAAEERPDRHRELTAAGATAVVACWREAVELLAAARQPA
jgi:beta-phosphoglucomutase-like phosphatase (HAD superfamily)